MVAYAVVRIRGSVGIKKDIGNTMEMLMLKACNNCVIIPDNPYYKGMLQKVKDYVTWGEVSPEVLSEMLSARAEVSGNETFDEAMKKSGFNNTEELAKAMIDEGKTLKDIDSVKRTIRLHPPKKGYEGIKRPFVTGGALGYRGEKINDLIRRML